MMATGRLRPAAIALIFLLDPPWRTANGAICPQLSRAAGDRCLAHFSRRRLRMRPDKRTVDQ